MRKKKLIRLVIIILIILAIITGITQIISKNKTTQQLASIYNTIKDGQPYLFEMERNDENKVIMAQKDNKIIIDQYSKNNHSTTVVKDNNTYLILHNREEYYVYEQNNVKQNILPDGIKEFIDKTFETGTEKIKGKKYSYEEYFGSTMFIIANDLDISQENVKTRFFFDNDGNLAYIKTMTENDQELLKINLTNEVNDDIFNIPSHYAEY